MRSVGFGSASNSFSATPGIWKWWTGGPITHCDSGLVSIQLPRSRRWGAVFKRADTRIADAAPYRARAGLPAAPHEAAAGSRHGWDAPAPEFAARALILRRRAPTNAAARCYLDEVRRPPRE
jgi:hypothetical protein